MVAAPRVSAFLSTDGVLARYGASFVTGLPWVIGAGVCVALLGVAFRFGFPRRYAKHVAIGLVVVAAVLAWVNAWHLAWVCDDAFISFRYADNWADGRGLVYNVGERVEGYTNFLWTAILALGILVSIEPGHLALVLSLGCFAGVLAVTALYTRRLLPDGAVLPGMLAIAGLASSYTFASYGTSGLETMAGALLVLVAVERADAGFPLVSGTLGVLATMLHPDHLLFYAGLGAALAFNPRPRIPRLLRYAAPFVCLFVPYFIARWAYYGDPFPNTYYTKSGGAWYFSQGSVYLVMCGIIAGLFGTLPFAGFGVFVTRKTLFARFMLIAIPLYLAYVGKIGGDFMLGRLLVSAMPPLLIAAEIGVRRLLEGRTWPLGALGLLLFVPVALPNGVVRPGEKFLHVADERTFYPLKRFEPLTVDASYTTNARAFKRVFRNAPRPPKLAIGAIGIVGYFTRYPIQDTLGLVNREVAHIRIRSRTRPGHEKIATPGHVLGWDVDFTDIATWPKEYAGWTAFRLDSAEFWIVHYDPRLARSARRELLKIPDIEGLISGYAPIGRTPAKRACDLWFFDQVYFSRQKNESLRRRLTAAVTNAEPGLAGLEDLLVGPLPENGKGWRARRVFSFDTLTGFTLTGDAFKNVLAIQEIPGQEHVLGATGRFINGFGVQGGDHATGTLRSPKFTLSGDALTLQLGGGQSKKIEVRLLVGGTRVAFATGCESDVLGRRVFATGNYRGREAEIEVIDRGEGGWEHVAMDEVVEWTRIP